MLGFTFKTLYQIFFPLNTNKKIKLKLQKGKYSNKNFQEERTIGQT